VSARAFAVTAEGLAIRLPAQAATLAATVLTA